MSNKFPIFPAPRQCIICGKLAEYECRECFGQCGSGLESIAFCAKCMDKVCSLSYWYLVHYLRFYSDSDYVIFGGTRMQATEIKYKQRRAVVKQNFVVIVLTKNFLDSRFIATKSEVAMHPHANSKSHQISRYV